MQAGPVPQIERLFQFSLLGMVASGYLAVAGSGYLDRATILLTAAALLLRLVIISGLLRVEFSAAVVTVVSVLYAAFYALDYFVLSREFVTATVHLVLFLAIVKIVTARTDRDYLWVKVIAFLELLVASVMSGSLSFLISLAAFLIFSATTLVTSEIRRAASGPVRVVRGGLRFAPFKFGALALAITAWILVLTGGLFYFLPRSAHAAFRHLVSNRQRLSGFASEITLGQLGAIKRNTTTVMHVRFIRPARTLDLKWRGMALSQFDGRTWSNPPSAGGEQRIETQRGGLIKLSRRTPSRLTPRIEYEVHVKDIGADTLFLAETPEYLNINAPFVERLAGDSYRMPATPAEGNAYIGYSYIRGAAALAEIGPDPLSAVERRQYLALPPLDPRVAPLAAAWTDKTTGDDIRVADIERHLRTDYRYSLSELRTAAADPLAHFLFERRAGHCEYFASSMAVLLRTLGIPSRVVTGFQSGAYNPVSGWQVIRASDAHSWVEAYLPGSGWNTFDPTPPDLSPPPSGVWERASMYFDAAETFWQEWVLNYDLEHQLVLASRVQQSGRGQNRVEAVNLWLARTRRATVSAAERFGLPILAVALFAWLARRYAATVWHALMLEARFRRVGRGTPQQSDASLLYRRMLRALKKRGFEKPAWLTASEFAAMVRDPQLGPLVKAATESYHELRFGGDASAGPRMLAVLERLDQY